MFTRIDAFEERIKRVEDALVALLEANGPLTPERAADLVALLRSPVEPPRA